MKNVMKKAHEITKNIIRKGDSYRETFRLALIFVHSQLKKGVNKMIELKGSEKQVKWAKDIREEVLNVISEGKELLKEDVINSWETYSEKKKAKFGTMENLINARTLKVENSVKIISNIEESTFFIEKLKNILVTERYFQSRLIGEVAKNENWDFIDKAMVRVERKYWGK